MTGVRPASGNTTEGKVTDVATPSTAARRVAGATWPDVQQQRKVAPGTFGFSCSGHGGLVAIIGEAPLSTEAIARFREKGLVELVAFGRGRSYTTASGYEPQGIRDWAAATGAKVYEAIVGEEDCDWALLAYESDAIREGMAEEGYSTPLTREEVLTTVERWNPRWLGIEPTGPDIAEGEAVMKAAWGDWHERVPEGRVGVAVEYTDGRKVYGIVPREAYEGSEQRGSHPISSQRIINVTELEEVGRL